MGGTVNEIKKVVLSGTKNGRITITAIEKPYGANSESVASIGISLKANATEPEWKVHIPKTNIDEVIEALQKVKETI